MRLNGIRWGIIKGMIKDHTNVSREKDLLRVLCELFQGSFRILFLFNHLSLNVLVMQTDFLKEMCFYLWIENGLTQLNPNPYRQMRDNLQVKNHPDNKLCKVVT